MTSASSPRSSTRHLLLGLLLGAALLPLLPGAAGGAEVPSRAAEELRERARAIVADPRFQESAPATVPAERPPREPSPPPPPPEREPVEPIAAVAVSSLGTLLGYTVLAVALILAVLWIAREIGGHLGRRRRSGGEGPAALPAAAAPSPRDADLASALALASQGRHAEALHALLLTAIHRLSARSPAPPPPSRTSRALARTLPLKGDSRLAFGELVAAVERSLFGGAAVGAEEFERNLARYRVAVGERG